MKKSLRLLSLLAVMVLLSVTLVGCEKKPEVVLKNMADAQAKVKSYAYTFDFSSKVTVPASATVPAGTQVDIKVSGLGQAEVSAEAPKQSLDLKIDAVTEGMTLSASGNMISDNKIAYLKLNTVPNFGLFDLSSIKGVWYKIDLAKAMETSGQNASALNYTPEQLAQMQKLLTDRDLLTVVNNYGIEKLDKAGSVYHYKVKFIQEELKKVIIEASKIAGAKELTAEESKSLDDGLTALNKADIDLWIGAKDFLVKKMALGLTVEEAGNSVRVDGTVLLTDYNKPVKIEIPANATEFNPAAMMGASAPAPTTINADEGYLNTKPLTQEEIDALNAQLDDLK